MDTQIYVDKDLSPDNLIARIDSEGKMYAIDAEGEEYLGWIDYEKGDVYDSEDYLLGWAEEDGAVVFYIEEDDEDEEIGYVTEDGQLYYFAEPGDTEAAYFGKVAGMHDFAEGAAALLFFLAEEEEEE